MDFIFNFVGFSAEIKFMKELNGLGKRTSLSSIQLFYVYAIRYVHVPSFIIPLFRHFTI